MEAPSSSSDAAAVVSASSSSSDTASSDAASASDASSSSHPVADLNSPRAPAASVSPVASDEEPPTLPLVEGQSRKRKGTRDDAEPGEYICSDDSEPGEDAALRTPPAPVSPVVCMGSAPGEEDAGHKKKSKAKERRPSQRVHVGHDIRAANLLKSVDATRTELESLSDVIIDLMVRTDPRMPLNPTYRDLTNKLGDLQRGITAFNNSLGLSTSHSVKPAHRQAKRQKQTQWRKP